MSPLLHTLCLMETSKVISDEKSQSKSLTMPAEEKKRLVDFFSLLIEIDQRNKRKEVINNEKQDN